MKWISLVLCIAVMLILGGCKYQMTSGSLGEVRSSDKAFSLLLGPTIEIRPAFEIIFSNRTDLLADIYIGSNLIIENVSPGQIVSYGLFEFGYGDKIVITVICHKDGVLVGYTSGDFRLSGNYRRGGYTRSSGNYGRSRYTRTQVPFNIDRLDLTMVYGDVRKDSVSAPSQLFDQ